MFANESVNLLFERYHHPLACNAGLAINPNCHTPITKLDSIPIALPHPPQTRAASFKRLYPK